ncbi:MAG: 3-methyl-2-oxobutanoate hydroxymethyltransferase [Lentisphaerae bacterium]|nr:3-methyl-2-oxobutanoate hydroxymethyltransferase [Lentisphaerota bacterium]
MSTAWTTTKIRATKGREKLACLTAYDFMTARLLDEAGLPLILVGDSLAMTVLGYANTLPVTMEEMLHHTRAVTRAVKQSLVVGDMPFMSYQVSFEQAVANAGRFLKEGGAGAVKIEGGAFRRPLVETLIDNGIPVLGHIGLTPQSVRKTGGYKVEGRTADAAAQLLTDARELEAAGCFALVLECMPSALAAEITQAVKIPTIGIGAGPHCDGQILVCHDILGMFPDFTPKFVRRYAELGRDMIRSFAAYKQDVEGGTFPAPEHEY